jgi:hypothetical protein
MAYGKGPVLKGKGPKKAPDLYKKVPTKKVKPEETLKKSATGKPKTSYDAAVMAQETGKRYKAVRKYVDRINGIVYAGAKGTKGEVLGVEAHPTKYKGYKSNETNVKAVSATRSLPSNTVYDAIQGRKARVLRGTNKKAK